MHANFATLKPIDIHSQLLQELSYPLVPPPGVTGRKVRARRTVPRAARGSCGFVERVGHTAREFAVA